MNYFWSDPHLGHDNIIRYCNRPFIKEGDLDNKGNWKSEYIANLRCEEMDKIIIKNVNEKVDINDTLICLGDFCMTKSSEASNAPKKAFDYYRNQIKCKNIIFIKGNHDSNNSTKTIIESMVINHGGKRIYLTHNPKFAKEDFHWNFCGHTHGNQGTFKKLGRKSVIIDLSVDCWGFRPIDINEINQAYSEWCRRGCKDEKKN
jgi:calcineurin-like phosphoesterase family protein